VLLDVDASVLDVSVLDVSVLDVSVLDVSVLDVSVLDVSLLDVTVTDEAEVPVIDASPAGLGSAVPAIVVAQPATSTAASAAAAAVHLLRFIDQSFSAQRDSLVHRGPAPR
jgi:hypothetical protein